MSYNSNDCKFLSSTDYAREMSIHLLYSGGAFESIAAKRVYPFL